MLCPNTQAVTNGDAAGISPILFLTRRVKIWIWEKMHRKI